MKISKSVLYFILFFFFYSSAFSKRIDCGKVVSDTAWQNDSLVGKTYEKVKLAKKYFTSDKLKSMWQQYELIGREYVGLQALYYQTYSDIEKNKSIFTDQPSFCSIESALFKRLLQMSTLFNKNVDEIITNNTMSTDLPEVNNDEVLKFVNWTYQKLMNDTKDEFLKTLK